jgi:hypothetical protein
LSKVGIDKNFGEIGLADITSQPQPHLQMQLRVI